MLPSAYLAGRFVLAFPALSVDQPADVLQALGRSWEMTRRNGVKVLLLCVLAPIGVAWVLEQASHLPVPGISLICAIAVWLVMPVELALVALCYTALKPPQNQPADRV